MRLEKLILANFRNIQSASFYPGEELTVITGANGQGKTNLLEAVWLLTGAKSFRGAKDPQLIREGQQFAVMEGAILRQDRGEDYIRITVGTKDSPRPGRTAKLNGADAGRASELAGLFTAVVFEPGDLELVKGSPERRRRFIDAALCQLYPGYLATLRRYSRLIAQKNSLLKFWERTPGAAEMCDAFDPKRWPPAAWPTAAPAFAPPAPTGTTWSWSWTAAPPKTSPARASSAARC